MNKMLLDLLTECSGMSTKKNGLGFGIVNL